MVETTLPPFAARDRTRCSTRQLVKGYTRKIVRTSIVRPCTHESSILNQEVEGLGYKHFCSECVRQSVAVHWRDEVREWYGLWIRPEKYVFKICKVFGWRYDRRYYRSWRTFGLVSWFFSTRGSKLKSTCSEQVKTCSWRLSVHQ